MPLPYRILIKLDLDFNVGSGQDTQLPRPGDVISAGFTEFNGYQIDKYLVISEERGKHTVKVLKSQNLAEYDYWDGTGFVKRTQSVSEIKTRKDKAKKDAREIEEGVPEVIDISEFVKNGELDNFIEHHTVLGATGTIDENIFRNNEAFVHVFLQYIDKDNKVVYIPAWRGRP